jgi:hypothetical protein
MQSSFSLVFHPPGNKSLAAMSDHPPPATSSDTGRGGVPLQSRHRNGLILLGIIEAWALSSALQTVSLLSSPSLSLAKEEPGQQLGGGAVMGTMSSTATRSVSFTSSAHINRSGPTANNTDVRDMVGEWLGQTRVPPHPWRLFGPTELLAIYQNKRVLWVGDSNCHYNGNAETYMNVGEAMGQAMEKLLNAGK